MRVFAYTDGACKGNPGVGGWGVLLKHGSHEKEMYGFAPETTNNQMELTAIIRALEILSKSSNVTIVTDSQYVMKGVMEWMASWKKNGWKTASKQPVKNKELWEALDNALSRHSVEWEWVKGHAGHPENERADALANKAIVLQKNSA